MEARNHLHQPILRVSWIRGFTEKTIHPLNKGVLIFSGSWAVDIGLQRKQDVVCDALLVAENV